MWNFKTPGVPDELFSQSEVVPGPTKEEVRVITISKARLRDGFVVVDVGCGTGGLTVEAALQVGLTGKVFSIDENSSAIELTKTNVEKFNLQKIVTILQGSALDVLNNLPVVDAVLVGGSRTLTEVLTVVFGKLKPGGRVVINAILLQTACVAIDTLKTFGFQDIDVVEVFVAKGKSVPSGTMMLAHNPIKIISATKP
jgi:cobalt-precorrin-6B (C15)-methyltransferase